MTDTVVNLKDGIKIGKERESDSLLDSLHFIASYHRRATSKESLTSGLALHDAIITVDDFIITSKKIGLISKVVKRSIKDISALSLPSVLLLNDNKACVLVKMDIENDKFDVILPEISEGVTSIQLDELDKIYSSKMIIIKPTYDFKNKISNELEVEKDKHWFYGPLKKNMNLYNKVIVAAIFINLFVFAIPLFMKNVFDRVLPNNAVETLWAMTIGIAIILFFDFLLKILRAYYIGKAGKKADALMSNKIFDQVLSIKMDDKPASTGQFTSRLQSFENVREFFTSSTVALIVDIPFVFLFIAAIFYFSGALGWVPVIASVTIIIFTLIMQRKIKLISQHVSKEEQLKQNTLIETVTGLEIIKSIGAYSSMKAQWDNAIVQTSYYNEKLQLLSQINSFFISMVSMLATISIIVLGTYLALSGDITMGGIIAAMMINSKVMAPISKLVGLILKYEKSMIALNDLDQIMQLKNEKPNHGVLSRPNLNGDIEFKDISFAYNNQNIQTLSNINLKIKKGEKIAILGKIGSGKSTLFKLLLNLYTPSKGSILIGDTDVRQIDSSDLRKAVGTVPQEAFLFMGSVKNNITISEPYASDEEIIEVSKLTGVLDFIGRHEAGFDLQLGERGEGLSGGERQAITLARSLISNPNVLIMDEPTNSMDKQTENKFIKNVRNIIEDKTFIVITHKMSLLTLVDRVIVIDDGKIIADGPKDQVVVNKKGAV